MSYPLNSHNKMANQFKTSIVAHITKLRNYYKVDMLLNSAS